MKKTFQRGFTLIELLVVIAIIGILAAVVLASLNDARDSGTDAAIKQSVGNIRSQAEINYNQNGFSYDTVCTGDTKVTQLLTAAQDSAQVAAGDRLTNAAHADGDSVCRDTATEWIVVTPLVGTGAAAGEFDYWCADSAGRAQLVEHADQADVAGAADYGCN